MLVSSNDSLYTFDLGLEKLDILKQNGTHLLIHCKFYIFYYQEEFNSALSIDKFQF